MTETGDEGGRQGSAPTDPQWSHLMCTALRVFGDPSLIQNIWQFTGQRSSKIPLTISRSTRDAFYRFVKFRRFDHHQSLKILTDEDYLTRFLAGRPIDHLRQFQFVFDFKHVDPNLNPLELFRKVHNLEIRFDTQIPARLDEPLYLNFDANMDLRELEINFFDIPVDIYVSGLRHIRKLVVYAQIRSFVISHLPKLEEIEIQYYHDDPGPVPDLCPCISSCPSLIKMDMMNITSSLSALKSSDSFENFSRLKALCFSIPHEADFGFGLLSGLTCLNELHIDGKPGFPQRKIDFANIEALNKITYLSIFVDGQAENFSSISALNNLAFLDIRHLHGVTILPLTTLSQLTTLKLEETQVPDFDNVAKIRNLCQFHSVAVDFTRLNHEIFFKCILDIGLSIIHSKLTSLTYFPVERFSSIVSIFERKPNPRPLPQPLYIYRL